MPLAAQTEPTDDADAVADAASTAERDVLSWRVHRLRENPRGLIGVTGAYVAAFLLWYGLFPHPLALFLPTVALTSALAEYLFPISYRITTRGAYSANGLARLFIAWPDVKRATVGRDGINLSPFARPSRLDGIRGVRLRFSNGNDPIVMDIVRKLRREQNA